MSGAEPLAARGLAIPVQIRLPPKDKGREPYRPRARQALQED
jgi:hypothetical protein